MVGKIKNIQVFNYYIILINIHETLLAKIISRCDISTYTLQLFMKTYKGGDTIPSDVTERIAGDINFLLFSSSKMKVIKRT